MIYCGVVVVGVDVDVVVVVVVVVVVRAAARNSGTAAGPKLRLGSWPRPELRYTLRDIPVN